jgi:hypothetical protein
VRRSARKANVFQHHREGHGQGLQQTPVAAQERHAVGTGAQPDVSQAHGVGLQLRRQAVVSGIAAFGIDARGGGGLVEADFRGGLEDAAQASGGGGAQVLFRDGGLHIAHELALCFRRRVRAAQPNPIDGPRHPGVYPRPGDPEKQQARGVGPWAPVAGLTNGKTDGQNHQAHAQEDAALDQKVEEDQPLPVIQAHREEGQKQVVRRLANERAGAAQAGGRRDQHEQQNTADPPAVGALAGGQRPSRNGLQQQTHRAGRGQRQGRRPVQKLVERLAPRQWTASRSHPDLSARWKPRRRHTPRPESNATFGAWPDRAIRLRKSGEE